MFFASMIPEWLSREALCKIMAQENREQYDSEPKSIAVSGEVKCG